jgi:ATP-dependent helicase HrpB
MARTPLPIDELLPEILARLQHSHSLVLQAPPGAGKTTRVPNALLAAAAADGTEIWVLQPRRLATRLAAQRVAEEIGEPLGDSIGYQVRFEQVSSAKTRLRFVTEGILVRRLTADPQLRGIGTVVLDEFHERSLAADLSLALIRRLQLSTRPDLKLLVMSATLEAGPIAAYLDGSPVLRTEGRSFAVSIEHLPAADSRALEQQVLAGLKKVEASGSGGDVLVFLPGASEIRRAGETCQEFAASHRMEIRPLHGELPPSEQDLAVRRGKARKLILSTNVAETSVTIPGVRWVIDSGLARIASHSPWSGLPSLNVQKISKSSAAQRAGRAGRIEEGFCHRLYTRHDFESRPDRELPEIRRGDLTEMVLALRASGVRDLSALPFLDPPPRPALEAADELLRRLGATEPNGALTDIGRRLVELPMHPRQARIVEEASKRGVGEDGALIAALLGERDIRLQARSIGSGGAKRAASLSGPSDLLELRERFTDAERAGFSANQLRALGLEHGAVRSVERARRHLLRSVRNRASRPKTAEAEDEALMISVLAGYPDRVAKRRSRNSPELLMFGGGSAFLSDQSVVTAPELLIALDAETRGTGRGAKTWVRIASAVEVPWLKGMAPGEVRERDELQWNPETARVEQVKQITYGGLVLDEKRGPAASSAEASRILFDQAAAAGLGRFVDPESLAQWQGRVELVRRCFPHADLPELSDVLLRSALEALVDGKQRFADLEHPRLLDALAARYSPEQKRLLASMAPERIDLPRRRQLKVQYARGKAPWVESRLQDFFGMAKGPTVCGGKIALVLHLLAPNQRAVQVTEDLAGFWQRHYPTIRRELSRKYPRHPWPENPLAAVQSGSGRR